MHLPDILSYLTLLNSYLPSPHQLTPSALFGFGRGPTEVLVHPAPAGAWFDPYAYPLKLTTCPAVNRTGTVPVTVDIQIEYANIKPPSPKSTSTHATGKTPKPKKTLILVHGWPGLWSTWQHQIRALEDEYHLLVPNLRGFGRSSYPTEGLSADGEVTPGSGEAVQNSGTLGDVVGDLVCLMEKEGVRTAICVGHDWGAEVCYEAARARPDLFSAVAGAAVPYMPSAGPFTPIAALVPAFPRLAYQVYFSSETATATSELNVDIRRTLRATYRSVASPPPPAFLTSNTSYLTAYDTYTFKGEKEGEIPRAEFLSAEAEDYLVKAYAEQKFNYTLEFYTTPNRYEAWQLANAQGNFTIPQPALSILPSADPVANWTAAALLLHSAEFMPKLRQETLPTAHWPQLERPAEFNAILLDWLHSLDVQGQAVLRAHEEL